MFYILVFIWVMKHRAARKYRYELNRQMIHLMKYELLADVLHNVKKREVR